MPGNDSPEPRPSDGQALDAESIDDLEEASGYIDPCQEAQGLLPWHSLNLSRPKILFVLRVSTQ